jgi:hypothetical protein
MRKKLTLRYSKILFTKKTQAHHSFKNLITNGKIYEEKFHVPRKFKKKNKITKEHGLVKKIFLLLSGL